MHYYSYANIGYGYCLDPYDFPSAPFPATDDELDKFDHWYDEWYDELRDTGYFSQVTVDNDDVYFFGITLQSTEDCEEIDPRATFDVLPMEWEACQRAFEKFFPYTHDKFKPNYYLLSYFYY